MFLKSSIWKTLCILWVVKNSTYLCSVFVSGTTDSILHRVIAILKLSADSFKIAITLCKIESVVPETKTEHKYVEFLTTHKIHNVFQIELFKNISIEDLSKILNLCDENLKYEIPKGYSTKFYYLIRILNEYVEKRIDSNWRELILNKFNIKKSTYTSGSKKILSSENEKDLAFAEKVNNIFNKK